MKKLRKQWVSAYLYLLFPVVTDIQADIALTMDLSNPKVVSDTESLSLLLHPQNLVSAITPFSCQIGVTLATIRKMAEANELFLSKGLITHKQHRKLADETASYISNLEGYMKSVETLEKKVKGYSNLVRFVQMFYAQLVPS